MQTFIAGIIKDALAALRPILIPMAFVVAATIIAIVIVVPMLSRLRMNSRTFGWLSIFYELRGIGCVRLSCIWVKLCLLIIYLFLFDELSLQEYLIFLVPGLIYVLGGKAKGLFGRLFWFLVELVGLFTANVVCSYILDMRPGMIFTMIYVALSIFLVLFGVYLFMTELNDISEARTAAAALSDAEGKNERADGR